MGVVRFGAFTLDRGRRALLRDGAELELRSQSLDVLDYLIRHAGRVVAKDELFAAVWPAKPASDDSLVQCVTDIRRALGDDGHGLIKTVPRRGYMFVGAASAAEPAAGEGPTDGTGPAPARRSVQPAGAPQALWQRGLIAAVLLVTALGGSGWLLWSLARPAELVMQARPSLVVLPVEPPGDGTDGALATLADEIATAIWRAPRGFDPDLRPTSAIRHPRREPRALGRELGVRYIVRTRARREGARILLNVEVVEAEKARQVWVRSFDYEPGQPGAQGRTAARIGRELAAGMLAIEARRPLPAAPQAGHYVILGRELMNSQRSARTNAEAIALLEKAMRLEPEHFLANTIFARATADHVLNGWASREGRAERLERAEAAVQRALKRHPTSAGAHLTRGALLRARGEHELAVEAFREALGHNPRFANAYAELGRTLTELGRPREAIAEIEKAVALNETDFARYVWFYWAGLAALHAGDPETALHWLRRSHNVNAAYDNTYRLMAVALADTQRWEEARRKVAEFRSLRPEATADDWKLPGVRNRPEAMKVRKHIRETLVRLGLPEGEVKAAATPPPADAPGSTPRQ